MKAGKILGLLYIAAVLLGCAATGKTKPKEQVADIPAQEMTDSDKTEMLEHKGTALEINQLPVWVQVYLDQGIPGLDALADYDGYNCFVAENTGTSLDVIQQWVQEFTLARAANPGTQVVNDWWILYRRYQEGKNPSYTDQYHGFILVTEDIP
jgi:hypothetical protein